MSRLFSLVGTPSPTFYSTLNVVRSLVKIAVGAHDVVCANTFDELRALVAGAQPQERSVILYSDYSGVTRGSENPSGR